MSILDGLDPDDIVKKIIAVHQDMYGHPPEGVTIDRGSPGEDLVEAYRRAGIDVELVG